MDQREAVYQSMRQQASFSPQYAQQLAQHLGAGQLQQLGTLSNQESMTYTGKAYIVICNGQPHQMAEGATIEAAQELAESLAHQHQREAFILKPIRKVAPKRDVVTTDL